MEDIPLPPSQIMLDPTFDPVTSLGTLQIFPPEVRDMIYSFVCPNPIKVLTPCPANWEGGNPDKDYAIAEDLQSLPLVSKALCVESARFRYSQELLVRLRYRYFYNAEDDSKNSKELLVDQVSRAARLRTTKIIFEHPLNDVPHNFVDCSQFPTLKSIDITTTVDEEQVDYLDNEYDGPWDVNVIGTGRNYKKIERKVAKGWATWYILPIHNFSDDLNIDVSAYRYFAESERRAAIQLRYEEKREAYDEAMEEWREEHERNEFQREEDIADEQDYMEDDEDDEDEIDHDMKDVTNYFDDLEEEDEEQPPVLEDPEVWYKREMDNYGFDTVYYVVG